jgi:ATP-dependent helicase/nuclease subunit A
MNNGFLIKYSASAGSGKTTELTRKYISRLFGFKNGYRKILAVTFTNKAAAEMKSRILEQLWLISKGNLIKETERLSVLAKKTPEEIKLEARKILQNILHDYSRFFVGTIDSFFQKVLKSFTREAGLQSGYIIELDHSVILSAAVGNMLSGLGNDEVLLNWVAEFAVTRVQEGKNWNIKKEIISLAGELFREKYKLLSQHDREKLRDRNLLTAYVRELKLSRSDFFSHLQTEGAKIRMVFDRYGVTDDMFFQGKKGIPSFMKKISASQFDTTEPLNSYINKVLDEPPRWSTNKVPAPQLASALNAGASDLITGAIRYYNRNFINVNTVDAILGNIYTLGILSDILEHVHQITNEENKFLLSDAGELLYLIIGNDQTPFIYEKIGNSFEHYMIDEFQDTSAIQWNNFKPLIDNSLALGFENLVVGDVKQSIYRWRNSDWKIFDKVIDREIGAERIKTETLDTNYRSRENIVAFNNMIFSAIPDLLDNQNEDKEIRFSDLYADARQKTGRGKDGGLVSFDFIGESDEEKFNDMVMGRLPHVIEDLQDKGYRGSDIGILVRWNSEGTSVMNYMLNYRLSVDAEQRKKYNYEIISNESLILDQNPVVCFIISFLAWILNPSDDISRALTLRNFLLATGREISEAEKLLINYSDKGLEMFFPPDYKRFTEEIQNLSLFESVEKIIKFFSLGAFRGNAAYLNAFQDCVLQFSANNSSEKPAFLEWWSNTGSKKSILLSDLQDSVRVMTIHKSKGLQFKVVILPFLTWQLNHDRNPVIWIRPGTDPFDKLALVPVKYRKSLAWSHFADEYNREKVSSMVDNLNLVYVAFTRAVDCLIGFCPEKTVNRSVTVSTLLRQAMQTDYVSQSDKPSINPRKFFNEKSGSFLCGEIPPVTGEKRGFIDKEITLDGYEVNLSLNRLKLKFHGENFLVSLPEDQVIKLNYGRIMHEVFSLISTSGDIENAVEKLVLEGKIPESGKEELIRKISLLISSTRVKEWFDSSSVIMREAEILLPTGSTRRPDRIVLKDDRAIIVDFKFGSEKAVYLTQVGNYRNLMHEMGFKKVDAFLWYVDNNKIITV